MSDQELLDAVAEQIMGWRKNKGARRRCSKWRSNGKEWNPVFDWNDWRQVEEKMLDGPWELFVTELVPACSVDTDWAMHAYASTGLRDRCLAALKAARPLIK